MTQDDVRDVVIDWLHQHAPNLLVDDVIPEGLIFLCNHVWTEAQRDQWRKLMEAGSRPRTFELN
jgi:hypothetical protein